jgi:iron complex outermembrane recepter protein
MRLQRRLSTVCRARILGVAIAAAVVMSGFGAAPATAQELDTLSDASLETLLNVKVTSVSKKEQDQFRVASAVYVLTAEDIRRSGATSVAEALRLVPGASIGRVSGNVWRVGVRGFSGQFADKLLVLVDGMSVYDPVNGGVVWGAFDPPVEVIERIEVIRGPGAAVWGANAVNGVVNIITKEARVMQGAQAIATVGNVDSMRTMLHYGAAIGASGHYRFGIGESSDGRLAGNGSATPHVQRHAGMADFRMDLRTSSRDRWQIQALARVDKHFEAAEYTDLTASGFSQAFAEFEPSRYAGGMAQWTRDARPGVVTLARVFGLRTEGGSNKTRTASGLVGLEMQRHQSFGRHDVIFNLDARRTYDAQTGGGVMTVFSPRAHRGYQVSAFAQDDISLVRDRLVLTVGAKFGDTDLTAVGATPNVRLGWTPSARSTLWAGVAVADRTPARYLVDSTITIATGVLPNGLPTLLRFSGSRALKSESMTAYEAGYRLRVGRNVVVDATAFRNRYRDVIGATEPVTGFDVAPRPHVVLSSAFVNGTSLATGGAEVAVRARASARLELDGSYSWLHAPGSEQMWQPFGSPTHSGTIGGALSLGRQWEADSRLYLVGSLPGTAYTSPLDSFLRFDARLARTIGSATVSVAGQDLFGTSRLEMAPTSAQTPAVLGRSVHATINWQF